MKSAATSELSCVHALEREMSRVSTAIPALSENACTTGSRDCVARAGASSVIVHTIGGHVALLARVRVAKNVAPLQ
jgi:hypothetical protein